MTYPTTLGLNSLCDNVQHYLSYCVPEHTYDYLRFHGVQQIRCLSQIGNAGLPINESSQPL